MHKLPALLLACALAVPAMFASDTAHALSCGDTITSNVTLTADLHCTTGWTAMYVPTPGITINLNGHTLSGTSALSGISVNYANNVTIKGPGAITGFWAGVNAFRSDSLIVEGVDFEQLNKGIIVTLSQKSTLAANRFNNMSWLGISVTEPVTAAGVIPSGGHYFAYNDFKTSVNGIELCGMNTGSSLIENNAFSSLTEAAIKLHDASAKNTIRSNMIVDIGQTAIILRGGRDNSIKSNVIEYGNTGIALYPEFGGGCRNPGTIPTVAYNYMQDNTIRKQRFGIYFGLGLSGTRVFKNWADYNKLQNNEIGMYFRMDAYSNGGFGNDYTGTLTPGIDETGGNVY
jgi:hypothetical protein